MNKKYIIGLFLGIIQVSQQHKLQLKDQVQNIQYQNDLNDLLNQPNSAFNSHDYESDTPDAYGDIVNEVTTEHDKALERRHQIAVQVLKNKQKKKQEQEQARIAAERAKIELQLKQEAEKEQKLREAENEHVKQLAVFQAQLISETKSEQTARENIVSSTKARLDAEFQQKQQATAVAQIQEELVKENQEKIASLQLAESIKQEKIKVLAQIELVQKSKAELLKQYSTEFQQKRLALDQVDADKHAKDNAIEKASKEIMAKKTAQQETQKNIEATSLAQKIAQEKYESEKKISEDAARESKQKDEATLEAKIKLDILKKKNQEFEYNFVQEKKAKILVQDQFRNEQSEEKKLQEKLNKKLDKHHKSDLAAADLRQEEKATEKLLMAHLQQTQDHSRELTEVSRSNNKLEEEIKLKQTWLSEQKVHLDQLQKVIDEAKATKKLEQEKQTKNLQVMVHKAETSNDVQVSLGLNGK